MLKNVKKNQKGFTLVELIVVIAILGILATLLVPRIMGNVNDAKKNKEITNARTIASEITTHNALARVNGTNTVPNPLPEDDPVRITTSEQLGDLKLPKGIDFPDTDTVAIYVDKEGNGTVEVLTSTP